MTEDNRVSYNAVAVHFDAEELPVLLLKHLPDQISAIADLGCGDGPYFAEMERLGIIGPHKKVYAVDLQAQRLVRVAARFPYIKTLLGPADQIPAIPDDSLDIVISTMVMEHVPDEVRYLAELRRVLARRGRAFVTTVFKRSWAWYFRRAQGRPALDPSHLREYTDLEAFKSLVTQSGLNIVEMELDPLYFPLLAPLLFRLSGIIRPDILRILRRPRIRIPGYFSLNMILA